MKRVAKKAAKKAEDEQACPVRKDDLGTARRVEGRPGPSRARLGGTGRESTLDQTPETGRSVRGRTNPMPTRRSTGTPAGAGSSRQAPGLDRSRKQLRELEETVTGPPSSLDMDRNASAARSGRRHMQNELEDHTESSPAITGGDVDADWQEAYAVGDEAPGGDNPTPDQDRVDDIGKALGVTYEDNEELKAQTRSPSATGIAGSWIRPRRTTTERGSRVQGLGLGARRLGARGSDCANYQPR